jgi:hypothetical protein
MMNTSFGFIGVSLLFLGLILCLLSIDSGRVEKKRLLLRNIGVVLLLLDLVLVVVFPSSVHANDLLLASDIRTNTKAEYVVGKVKEADDLCNDVSMKEQVVVSGNRITERPVALCAFKESDQSWHVIRIAIMQPIPESYKLCVANAPTVAARADCTLPYHVVTQGYHVEHLSGYGITRLIFSVSQGGEHLVVYRTRHVWFDDKAIAGGDTALIVSTLRVVNYTPYHPDFQDTELTRAGLAMLYERIREVYVTLRVNRVPSRAFPKRLLADTVPWEIPMALAAIEQMDDKKFKADNIASIEAVYIEYALNGDEAFQWSVSSANAIGPFQFTNMNGNGTYRVVVERYPDAQLDPNFETGARDLTNVITAAICLIDLEVAQFPKIHTLYLRDPKLGGIYPVAAYNGGNGWAVKLYEWIKKRDIDTEDAHIPLPNMLTSERVQPCPCRVERTKGRNGRPGKRKVVHIVIKRQNGETPGYVEKYISVINYLGDIGLDK